MKLDGKKCVCCIYRHRSGLVKLCKESIKIGGKLGGWVFAKSKIIQCFEGKMINQIKYC